MVSPAGAADLRAEAASTGKMGFHAGASSGGFAAKASLSPKHGAIREGDVFRVPVKQLLGAVHLPHGPPVRI